MAIDWDKPVRLTRRPELECVLLGEVNVAALTQRLVKVRDYYQPDHDLIRFVDAFSDGFLTGHRFENVPGVIEKTVYLNVYAGNSAGCSYCTRWGADAHAEPSREACIKVLLKYEVGQFDD